MKRFIVWTVAYTLAILSALWACRYGFKAADTWWDSWLRGIVLAAIAVFAVHSFAWAYRTWNQGSKGVGFAVAGVGIVCFLVTLAGGVGTLAGSNDRKVAARAGSADVRRDTKAERDKLIAERDALPRHRPADTVESDLKTARAHERYKSSKGCEDITRQDTREHCAGLRQLEGELGAAQRAVKIEAELTALRLKLDKSDADVNEANPQAAWLSRITFVTPEKAEAWYGLGVALALELAAIATMLVGEVGSIRAALAMVAPPPKTVEVTVVEATPEPSPAPVAMITHQPEPAADGSNLEEGSVIRFMADAIKRMPGAQAEIGQAYFAYLRWCQRWGYRPVPRPEFDRSFLRVMKSARRELFENGDRIFVHDVTVLA